MLSLAPLSPTASCNTRAQNARCATGDRVHLVRLSGNLNSSANFSCVLRCVCVLFRTDFIHSARSGFPEHFECRLCGNNWRCELRTVSTLTLAFQLLVLQSQRAKRLVSERSVEKHFCPCHGLLWRLSCSPAHLTRLRFVHVSSALK